MDINMIKEGLHIIEALSSVIQTFPRSSICSRSLIFSTHGVNNYGIIVEVVRAFLTRILSTLQILCDNNHHDHHDHNSCENLPQKQKNIGMRGVSNTRTCILRIFQSVLIFINTVDMVDVQIHVHI